MWHIIITDTFPLSGFPFVRNLPYVYWQFNGNANTFYSYCYEKYGNIYEIYGNMRAIVLCRGECIDDFLSKNTHGLRFHNFKGPEELGFEGKARITNHGCLTIIFLISILSPKFTDEAIDQTN